MLGYLFFHFTILDYLTHHDKFFFEMINFANMAHICNSTIVHANKTPSAIRIIFGLFRLHLFPVNH